MQVSYLEKKQGMAKWGSAGTHNEPAGIPAKKMVLNSEESRMHLICQSLNLLLIVASLGCYNFPAKNLNSDV